jgi:hypothetical protein
MMNYTIKYEHNTHLFNTKKLTPLQVSISYLTNPAQPTNNQNSLNKHTILTLYMPNSEFCVNHAQPNKGMPWQENMFKLYIQNKKSLTILPNYPSPTHTTTSH